MGIATATEEVQRSSLGSPGVQLVKELTCDDVVRGMKNLPFTIELRKFEIKGLVDAMDIRGTGSISFAEFKKFAQHYGDDERRKALRSKIAEKGGGNLFDEK